MVLGSTYYDCKYPWNITPLPNSVKAPFSVPISFPEYSPPTYPLQKPDGGPAGYYDLPPNPKTLNDLLEYKGDKHWLGDSFHLANIVKAAWRWGIKSGTDKSYDARKFIYSGVRLLLKYQGLTETRKTLQKLLDDPQFGGEK